MSPIRPIALAVICALSLAPAAFAQTPPPPPTPPAQDPVRVEEHVVVSATKVEQQLVNAPATITVIGLRALEVSASQSYADLLRNVPGVNITQVSARDVNITPRGSTSTLSTNQLAVLDGRSLYQDFFGFVMWDFMPVNLNELKRIEVIRGPASAIWGANAVSGVINVITKTPREMLGTSVAIGVGTFDTSGGAATEDSGSLWYLNGTHAGVISDRASFKVSAGYYTQDAFARPTGTIPGKTTPYPAFDNQGTSQPKVDGRLDYSLDNGAYMTFSGGYSGTEGIMHSGIGPFDIESGTWMGYGKANYTRNAFRAQVFFNALDGDAVQLLTRGPGGTPIPFAFKTRTLDLEAGNVTTFGRNVLTYGGNLRHNTFDLTIAPDADSRTEGGAYLQDEIFLHDALRVVVGARVDKFTSIDGVVVSPRAAVVIKPVADQSIRVSYNRAFRAPSAINNHLDVTIAEPLPLGALHPLLAGGFFFVPIRAVGNPDLQEERLDAFEVGYTGIFGRTTLTAAWYLNRFKDQILFTQTDTYGISPPPAGFAESLGPLGPFAPLFWGGIFQSGIRFPSRFSYENFDSSMTQKGIELGVDTAINDRVSVYANYSWQGEPEPEDLEKLPLSELNLPPEHRFNTGLNFVVSRFLGSLGLSYVDEAFWQDVLDSRYHGRTDAYTLVNASAGMRFGTRDRFQVMLKGTNLTNEDIQQHIFGDIIKRQFAAEMRINF
ncbi:MAG TPA: TonB-dependent receptor [Vicinamibacterales bacterium]|nr:TonB-dependent receptor [Vicinamibacterales bacterium]